MSVLIIIGFLLGLCMGWMLRNTISAYICKEKKRLRAEQFQKDIKKLNTFHQIEQLKIQDDSKGALSNEVLY